MFRGLEFDFPQALYLLLLLPLFGFLYWLVWRKRDSFLQAFKGAPSLSELLLPRSKGLSLMRAFFFSLTWIFVVVALMQAKGNGRYLLEETDQQITDKAVKKSRNEDPSFVTIRRKAHEVIFLLDASASMDLDDTRIGKTRLNYAKEIIEEIVSQLDGQSVSLYAFTSEVTTLVPITHDYLFFRLVLKKVGINEGDVAGTDLMEALEVMRSKHFPDETSGKMKTLILLTDGGDTRLEALKGEEKQREMGAIASRLDEAEEKNLRVITIGMGTKSGQKIPGFLFEGKPVVSSLDETLLQTLSEKGRGRYYLADDYSSLSIAGDIRDLLDQDPAFYDEQTKELEQYQVERITKDENPKVYDLYFQYPLGLALFCLGVALLIPEVRKRDLKDDSEWME